MRFRESAPELWVAAERGETEGVRRLLAGGADIETRGGLHQVSPLVIAVGMGCIARGKSLARYEELVLLLLQHGADVSATDIFGRPALHVAASNGLEAVVLLLLQHGADVSSKGGDGWSPLHEAARQGLEQAILMLLEHGADVSSTDWLGQTPEEVARQRSHPEVAAMLKEAVSRAKCVAFAMGLLGRLGSESWVHALDVETMRMVLEQV